VWWEIQAQDFESEMRREQISDILSWCGEYIPSEKKEECQSLQHAILAFNPQETEEEIWILQRSMGLEESGGLLNLNPWDLAHYLAIFDYIYISRILSKSALDDLSISIARDVDSILFNPDLRAEQIQYWITIQIISGRSTSLRVRSINMLVETIMVYISNEHC
jgi:hypothetical protein